MALYIRMCGLATLRQMSRPKKTASSFSVNGVIFQAQRTLLTDDYKGSSSWRTRKILAVNMDELKITLDADFFDLKKPVSSVDLHKFVDNISDEHNVESAEQYLFCHRHSPVAHHLRASTVHCFIRACIDLGLADTALKVLKDKTNYGLFPDNFTFNLTLDDYIQREDIKGAAKVAMEMMTLEVLTNEAPLSQLLALYACHQYLKSGQCTEEETPDLGMTFADATRGHTSLLSSSYHILGLVMAGRFKQAISFVQASLDIGGDSGPCLVQDAFEHIQGLLDKQSEEKLDLKDTIKIERLHRLQGVLEEQSQEIQKLKHTIRELMFRLQADNRISTESLDSLITSRTLPQIEKLQQNHAHSEKYQEILETWHQEHIEAVRRQIRSAKEYEMTLKKKKLEKLLEATGGLRYWLEKERDVERMEDADKQTA